MRTHKNIIVTLQYNKIELTNRLVVDLGRYEPDLIDKIIIVDNGSDNNSGKMWYENWKTSSAPIQFEGLDENLGFTLGANYGLQQACKYAEERDLIFLISNDVEVNGPFIKQAEEYLLNPYPKLVGNRHIYWDSGWNKFGERVFDYLEGYFLATTKLGWQELGFFDPAYAPFDYEDVDLSTKAHYLGFNLVSLNNPNIIHQGGGTLGYNPEREAITKRNREYFKNKWVK